MGKSGEKPSGFVQLMIKAFKKYGNCIHPCPYGIYVTFLIIGISLNTFRFISWRALCQELFYDAADFDVFPNW